MHSLADRMMAPTPKSHSHRSASTSSCSSSVTRPRRLAPFLRQTVVTHRRSSGNYRRRLSGRCCTAQTVSTCMRSHLLRTKMLKYYLIRYHVYLIKIIRNADADWRVYRAAIPPSSLSDNNTTDTKKALSAHICSTL